MGRVKSRQQKETQVEDAIAGVVQAYQTGEHPSIKQAAESQGIAHTTLHDQLNGRQSCQKAHELDLSLGNAEEKAVVRRIEKMDHCDFPLTVDMVRHMATRILQQ